MKKIFYCLASLLLLTACAPTENKNQNKNQSQNDVTVTNDGDWAQQTTILASKPMVVDFFATWCGPCKELAPILDEVEQNHQGDVIFQRIDIDQKMDLAQEFRIQAVPTLMFVTPKGEYQMLEGVQDAATIEGKIAELLKRSAK